MEANRIWSSNLKFVEYGVRDASIFSCLVDQGLHRYLGLSRNGARMESIAEDNPAMAPRMVAAPSRKSARCNNADVLILRAAAAWHMLRFRTFGHAQYIALVPRLGPFSLLAIVVCLAQSLLRRLSRPRLVQCGSYRGVPVRLMVFQVRRPKQQKGARYFIPHAMGIAGFLDRLQKHKVRHAVLRWFETLPSIDPGEDMDLLVDDDDLDLVRDILDEEPGIQPCDLYTVTGLPGSDYRDIPYFPPYLSEQILRDAVSYRGICQVPAGEHHFLSLAYHALYHKGFDSGLPTRTRELPVDKDPEHDYASILGQLALRHGINVAITYEYLDEYLNSRGWRPPSDMLARLAKRNAWVRRQIDKQQDDSDDPGLAVFVIRQEAMNRGGLDRALSLLERHGFHIVRTKTFTAQEVESVARLIRGGNWGRGPYKLSAGPPTAAVVTYDTCPIKPTWLQRRRFPLLRNARLLSKKYVRRAFNEGFSEDERCNVVHSSDNSHEALDYIRIILPEAADEIQTRIAEIQQEFSTDETVLGTLTRFGRRAKVELIDLDGRRAVKKTFKSRQARYCQREAAALRELSRTIPEIPPLLHADTHSVCVPYYDDIFGYKRSSGKLLPLSVAKQAIDVQRRVYEAGYALLDASIDNLLIDRQEGLKLIDFEFAIRYDDKPASFEQSYDIAGCPEGFSGDVPLGGERTYEKNWLPYVGLSLHSLFHDPVWLQHVKRTGYYVTHLHRFLPRRVRHYYRISISAVRSYFGPDRSEQAEDPSPVAATMATDGPNAPHASATGKAAQARGENADPRASRAA